MLDEQVLVLGDGPVAEAMCSVLGLFSTKRPQLSDWNVLLNRKPDGVSIESGNKEIKALLRRCPLVISVGNKGVNATDAIRQVHRLRTDFLWESRYLGVMENHDERARLLELSLLGDTISGFCFGKVSGHAAVCLPLVLAELLNELRDIGDLFIEEWKCLLDKSIIARIKKNIAELEKALGKTDGQEAVSTVQKILEDFRKVYWPVLLGNPHGDIKLVNDLIEEYPPERSLEVDDCRSIVQKVGKIFKRMI